MYLVQKLLAVAACFFGGLIEKVSCAKTKLKSQNEELCCVAQLLIIGMIS